MKTQPRFQQTIARVTQVSGFGYWSGQDVTVQFHPAPADTGIVFVRRDLPDAPPIAARAEHRVEVPRRTNLSAGNATVEMVEHVLAALAGLHIDNCQVHVTAAEMPGCDGSSQPFVVALRDGGIKRQTSLRAQLVVAERTRVGDTESWVEAQPSSDGTFTIDYRLDYGFDHPIGRESCRMKVTPESFQSELAAARTFIMREEADWLRSRGLARRVTAQDVLVFDEQEGLVDNSLRYEDECVRHKVLDLVGDLALAGCDLVGHFIARRSGHRLNAQLVQTLLEEANWSDISTHPHNDRRTA